MTAARTALVIGGGVAGPVLAMALHKAGITATVHEARTDPDEQERLAGDGCCDHRAHADGRRAVMDGARAGLAMRLQIQGPELAKLHGDRHT